jgi:hypothetical protein
MFLLRALCPGRHPCFFGSGSFLPTASIRTANLELKVGFCLVG